MNASPAVVFARVLAATLAAACVAACQPAADRSSTPDQAPSAPYVVVLGTAQDGGFPQAGCTKDCCRDAAEKERRGRVVALGIIDPANGKRWLVEATPDFPDQLRDLVNAPPRASLSNVRGVFLSHGHIGHYTGLMHLGREVMGAKAMPVFAMPRMRAFLTENGPWSQLVKLGNIALKPMQNGRAIQLAANLSVTPLLVPHRDEFTETVGFRIQGPSRALLFIPDIDKWSKWTTPLAKALANVDVALLDGTFFDGDELPGRDMAKIPHPFIVETIATLRDAPSTTRAKVHFIHLNHTNRARRVGTKAHNAVVNAGMSVARDGERFSL